MLHAINDDEHIAIKPVLHKSEYSPGSCGASPESIRRRLQLTTPTPKLDGPQRPVQDEATPEDPDLKGKGKDGRPSSAYSNDFGDTVRSLFHLGPSDAKQLAAMKHAQTDMSTRCARAELRCIRQDEEIVSLKLKGNAFTNEAEDLHSTVEKQKSELLKAGEHLTSVGAEVEAARLEHQKSSAELERTCEALRSDLKDSKQAAARLVDVLATVKGAAAASKEQLVLMKDRSSTELERTCEALRSDLKDSKQAAAQLVEVLATVKGAAAASKEQLVLMKDALVREQGASAAGQMRLAAVESENVHLSAQAKQCATAAESNLMKVTSKQAEKVAQETAQIHQAHQDEMASAILEAGVESRARIEAMEGEVAQLAQELAVEKQNVESKVSALVEHESRRCRHRKSQQRVLEQANTKADTLMHRLSASEADVANLKTALAAAEDAASCSARQVEGLKEASKATWQRSELVSVLEASVLKLRNSHEVSMAAMAEKMKAQDSEHTAKFEAATSQLSRDKVVLTDALADAKGHAVQVEDTLASTALDLKKCAKELKSSRTEGKVASDLAASKFDLLSNELASTKSVLAEAESKLAQIDHTLVEHDQIHEKYEATEAAHNVLIAAHASLKTKDAKSSAENIESASLISLLKVKLYRSIAENNKKVELIATLRAEVKSWEERDEVRALEEMRQLYLKENTIRKVLQNKLRELNGNIRVMCRIRPHPSPDTDVNNEIVTCPDFDTEQPTVVKAPFLGYLNQSCNYEFDRVFAAGKVPVSQEDVFKASTEPIVTAVLDGYNVAIIAYGQTGTGKTHTMMGTREDPGVIFRSVDHLLESSNADLNTEYTFTVELLEVYLDKLVDLLSGNPISEQVCTIKGGTVANLEQRKVTTTEEVIAVMEEGRANRKVASTVMNSESSRSHFLVFITVDGLNKVTGKTSSAKLTLVDLAGSERLAKVHAKNSKRLAETVSINKSLASLGHVFTCIHSGAKHVPFRNSKLTHVLQEVMTADTKVCIFMHVSSVEADLSETLSTMRFGITISTIEQGRQLVDEDGGCSRRSIVAGGGNGRASGGGKAGGHGFGGRASIR